MLIYEIVTNRKGETIEDTGPYESPTENITELFRLLESKHGRSMGSISVPVEGVFHRVGWKFRKKVDGRVNDIYVTLHNKPDKIKTVKQAIHYYYFLD